MYIFDLDQNWTQCVFPCIFSIPIETIKINFSFILKTFGEICQLFTINSQQSVNIRKSADVRKNGVKHKIFQIY